MIETIRYTIANALYRLGLLLFTGYGLRQCDALRDALSVIHAYLYASGPTVTSMDDAERALKFAFAEADKIDRYKPALYAAVGFVLGGLLVGQAVIVGYGGHP